MTTLAELVVGKTYAQMREELFEALRGADPAFPVDSWREGDVARTLVEIDAQSLAELSVLVSRIAEGGFLSTSRGAWLTLLAREVYGLERNVALAAAGEVVLTDAGAAGPFTIAPGQLWFASQTGLRYQSANTANLTLAQGGTLAVPVRAEAPGAAYNVANGSITSMLTPLPGVTATNPAIGGTGTWVTAQGTDEESDAALATRCAARWPELGTGSPAASYDLWARSEPTKGAQVTRTNVVPDAAGPNGGGVLVYLAGPSGPVAADVVTAVQSYIGARAPLTVVPTVQSTSGLALTVTATLYGKAQYQAAATAAALSALQVLIAGTPVGGKVYRAAIFEALMAPAGVENVAISAPAGDTTLTAAQVATLTANLSWSNL
jgi:uncharacterized phage protein gp47/JayE